MYPVWKELILGGSDINDVIARALSIFPSILFLSKVLQQNQRLFRVFWTQRTPNSGKNFVILHVLAKYGTNSNPDKLLAISCENVSQPSRATFLATLRSLDFPAL